MFIYTCKHLTEYKNRDRRLGKHEVICFKGSRIFTYDDMELVVTNEKNKTFKVKGDSKMLVEMFDTKKYYVFDSAISTYRQTLTEQGYKEI